MCSFTRKNLPSPTINHRSFAAGHAAPFSPGAGAYFEAPQVGTFENLHPNGPPNGHDFMGDYGDYRVHPQGPPQGLTRMVSPPAPALPPPLEPAPQVPPAMLPQVPMHAAQNEAPPQATGDGVKWVLPNGQTIYKENKLAIHVDGYS